MKTPLQLVTEALRSGKYKQGRHKLESDSDCSFCCLGVMCKVAQEQGISVSLNNRGILIGGNLFHQKEVVKWLKIKEYSGRFSKTCEIIKNTKVFSLTNLNDYGGFSFLEIADFMEERKEDLFE